LTRRREGQTVGAGGEEVRVEAEDQGVVGSRVEPLAPPEGATAGVDQGGLVGLGGRAGELDREHDPRRLCPDQHPAGLLSPTDEAEGEDGGIHLGTGERREPPCELLPPLAGGGELLGEALPLRG
jgi:hypothetical protein